MPLAERRRASKAGRARVLVLTSTFPRWRGDPAPTFVADLCDDLAERVDITVLAPGSKGAARRERWGKFAVERYPYSWPGSTQQLADGAILPNIKRNRLLAVQAPMLVASQLLHAWGLARTHAFDVVHAHWVLPQGVVSATLRSRLGMRTLTTAHGADVYALRTAPATAAKRWAIASSDRITAVSSALADEVLALGAQKECVSVLPMGVDTLRFHPDARRPWLRQDLRDCPIVLFVGRLVEKKGAGYAIEAMPDILTCAPHARLLIVGDGPLRRPLMQLARQLGVESRVTFAGAITHDELPAYFASADVFVGPSVVEENGDTESFGLVFAEALASGCPVVATDAGGIGDIVIDGETGLVVPQRDAVALAAAVTHLLDDRQEAGRLAANGLDWVRERFERQTIATRYGNLIDEVMAA